MGNRTFVIMLAACLLQIFVVAGTVSYVGLRDSGAADAPAAEAAAPGDPNTDASQDDEGGNADADAGDTDGASHDYGDETDGAESRYSGGYGY